MTSNAHHKYFVQQNHKENGCDHEQNEERDQLCRWCKGLELGGNETSSAADGGWAANGCRRNHCGFRNITLLVMQQEADKATAFWGQTRTPWKNVALVSATLPSLIRFGIKSHVLL